MADYNDGIIPEPCLRLDYGFGQEYASVELGDGTGYVRVTDDLRDGYHKMRRWYNDELKSALDSNDELRMRNASLEAALEGMHLIREHDKDENSKLRELVEILMPMVMRSQRYCSYICDVREQCISLSNPVYGCIKRKDIMKRADELAIEVES